MASLITKGEFRTERRLICFRASMLLALILAAVFVPARTALSNTESPANQQTGVAAFAAVRHSDTIETRTPYQVAVRQLSGPNTVGGYIEYSVWNSRGQQTGSDRVRLAKSNSTPEQWTGAIPGQSTGSVIKYHYTLATGAGVNLRHPSNPSADYRFRIIPFHLLSLRFQKSEMDAGKKQEITLSLVTGAPMTGEIVLRTLPPSSSEPADVHIQLLTDNGEHIVEGLRQTLRAKLPALAPGQVADFYFQLRNQNGDVQTLPADAPAQLFSVKRSLSPLRCIPASDRFVLGVTAAGPQRWISLKGGGTWGGDPNAGLEHWDTCRGILSNISRFAAGGGPSDLTYVGNDHGVLGVSKEMDIPSVLLRPEPSAWGKNRLVTMLGRSMRAGPATSSSLDGVVLFQYQQEQVLEQRYPQAVFLQIDSGKLAQYSFPTSAPKVVGLSSASFDATDGCWLLGAFVIDGDENLAPAILRRCGDSVVQVRLRPFEGGNSRAEPQRVIAFAKDPATGNLVIALEYKTSKDQTASTYGVFRVREKSGQLAALAPELEHSTTEITALGTDWIKQRILVGTFGKGLWQIKDGKAEQMKFAENLPGEITSISLDDLSGEAFIGTSDGAFEINGADHVSSMLSVANDALPANSLPMDVKAAPRVVLFSSYSAGLTEFEHNGTNVWHRHDVDLPRARFAGALFGDAQFTASNGIAAVLYSKGLLLADSKGARVLGQKEGLYSTSLFRILALHSGEIWLAYRPLPFGQQSQGALQLLKNAEVIGTFKIPDRGLATIARWIEVPERSSVLAATPAGITEIRMDGTVTPISSNPVSSIARSSRTGLIGAVGSTIERWDGQKFVSVLFQVDHPRWSKGTYSPGSPIDVAIDSNNVWYVLYNRGIVAILNPELQFVNVFDPEDGVPETAQRLIAVPGTDEIFIGSTAEGVVALRSPK